MAVGYAPCWETRFACAHFGEGEGELNCISYARKIFIRLGLGTSVKIVFNMMRLTGLERAPDVGCGKRNSVHLINRKSVGKKGPAVRRGREAHITRHEAVPHHGPRGQVWIDLSAETSLCSSP